MTRARVVVTQPYVAKYRVALWDKVSLLLKEHELELRVHASLPTKQQTARGDMAEGHWLSLQHGSEWSLFGHTTHRRPYPALTSQDTLVTEFTALNLIAWRAVAARPGSTLLWGHASAYVDDPTWMGTYLKGVLGRRAAHIMTYTNRGRDFAIRSLHIPGDKVTSIGNSTDTNELKIARDALSETQITSTRSELDAYGPTAFYSGGLDQAKRIDFLADAADQAVAINPAFRLIVAGRGQDAGILVTGSRAKYIKPVGHVLASEMAKYASISTAIWMPGRIGLIAVDALALGLPIHSMQSAYHAPEIDFLTEGDSLYMLADSPRSFAAASLALMDQGNRLGHRDVPQLDAMAAKFVNCVLNVRDHT